MPPAIEIWTPNLSKENLSILDYSDLNGITVIIIYLYIFFPITRLLSTIKDEYTIQHDHIHTLEDKTVQQSYKEGRPLLPTDDSVFS